MQTNKRGISVVLFILLLSAVGLTSYFVSKRHINVDKRKRQVVFLSNGQVFFGNLGNMNGDYAILSDVFYPQSEASPTNGDTKRRITLKPLSETYTSENTMFIKRDHILHFENLADVSKVNEAIDKFKANPNASPSPIPSP
jgi:hypothetical protein